MWVLIINTKFATVEPKHIEMQKKNPKRKYFEKKDCFTQDSNLGPQKLLLIDLTPYHYTKQTRHGNIKWIFHLYDLDCVNDQHSHGISDGKYFLVIWVNGFESIQLFTSFSSWLPAPQLTQGQHILHLLGYQLEKERLIEEPKLESVIYNKKFFKSKF